MGKIIHEFKKISGRLIFPTLLHHPFIPSFRRRRKRGGDSDKILIIKDDSIGDFLLFSGILNFYLKRFGEKVYCLVNNNVEEVARLYTENIIAVDNKKYFTSLKYRYHLLNRLNDIGFGTAVNSILNSSESRDMLYILKIPTTYLYGNALKKQKQWKNTGCIIPAIKIFNENGRYTSIFNHEKHYLESVVGIRVADDEIKPFIPFRDSLSEKLVRRFSLLNDAYIVFSLSSGALKRNYPINKFMEVIEHLHSKFDMNAVVIGQEEGSSITLPDFIDDLRGKTSLIETFGIIKNARLFIGNETGITHASWIMGVPTVMILGGGHFGRFLPMYDNGQAVYKHKDCYCCDWKCRYKDIPFRCIGEINTTDIVKVVEELLS